MASNVSMSGLHAAYEAEDAAITRAAPAEIQRHFEMRASYFEALVDLKPRTIADAREALSFVLFIFSEGANMEPDDSAATQLIVAGALAELKTNGLTLAFVIAIRRALQTAPGEDNLVHDVYVTTVLRNVSAWASSPRAVL